MSSRRDSKIEERAIDRAIDETKDSTKRVLQDAKKELPVVTATFHDYQEQNIKAIRDMTETFLDSQKEVAKAMLSSSGPLTNNAFTLMFMPWLHPQVMTDNYVKIINNFADTSVAAARLSSELMQEEMEHTRSTIAFAQNNTKLFSQYYTEIANSIEEANGTRTQTH